MKTKFLYAVSGFLAMGILCAVLFAPQIYFQYDNWQEEMEDVAINTQMGDLTTPEKLMMLYCTTMTNGDSPLREPYRYSKTFIPSGMEIDREQLGQVMGWEFSKIGSIFHSYSDSLYSPYDPPDTQLYVSRIASLLTDFPQNAITEASMFQIVSLEESTRGFVVWQVEFETKLEEEGVSIRGYVDMDAVSGKFLYWQLFMTFDSYPSCPPFSSVGDMDAYYENMMQKYFEFVTVYWKLDVQPVQTDYTMGSGLWNCYDFESGQLTATMSMQKEPYFDSSGSIHNAYSWTSQAYPIQEEYESQL